MHQPFNNYRLFRASERMRIKNNVDKGENTRRQHFLCIFPKCIPFFFFFLSGIYVVTTLFESSIYTHFKLIIIHTLYLEPRALGMPSLHPTTELPIPSLHSTTELPTPSLHSTIELPKPSLHSTTELPIPSLHSTTELPIPSLHSTTELPIPSLHSTTELPIPSLHSTTELPLSYRTSCQHALPYITKYLFPTS